MSRKFNSKTLLSFILFCALFLITFSCSLILDLCSLIPNPCSLILDLIFVLDSCYLILDIWVQRNNLILDSVSRILDPRSSILYYLDSRFSILDS